MRGFSLDIGHRGNCDGEIQIAFSSVPTALPLVKAGKAKAPAVTPKRTVALPGVPTIAESDLSRFELTLS